jgi:serpin B
MKLKKLTALFTALTLLAGSLGVLPVSAAGGKKGDVNENGEVDVADAVLLARYNAEDKEVHVSEQGVLNADLNLDGKATSDDSVLLLGYLAGLNELPPDGSQTEYRSQNLMEGMTVKPAAGTEADDAFKLSQLDLSVNLLRQNCMESEGKNVLISPLSIALALCMTANGAKGQTLSEMEQVFGGGLSIDKINDFFAGWLTSIEGEKEQKLYAADAIWVRNSKSMIDVPEDFLRTCADYYRADAYMAPFDNTTVDDINGWVNTNTHEMINKILDYKDLDADSVMVLANALAFEALWADPYEKYAVSEQAFFLENGFRNIVEMMYSTEDQYLESDGAIGFVKPYEGGKYSFAAVLPPKGKTVDEYLASLDGKGLKALLDSKTYDYDVKACLPKFRFDFGNSLKKTLIALGMPTAFGQGGQDADFTGLNSVPGAGTHIGDVLHKTFIDLSESGTKAAAVTAVIMKNESMPMPKEQKKVFLDHPFLFMILDNTNGLPVFFGTVKDIGKQEIVDVNPAAKQIQEPDCAGDK